LSQFCLADVNLLRKHSNSLHYSRHVKGNIPDTLERRRC
jgi:hypothetical protein